MKKFDWILIIAVLALALLLYGGWALFHPSGEQLYAIAELDGVETARLPLSEEGQLTVDCGDGEYNRIVVEKGYVRVLEATCPDKICVNTGKINQPGDSIVCLPHRLVIRVERITEE